MIWYEEFNGNINIETIKKHRKQKNGTYWQKRSSDILTFDIEVTSAWVNEYGSVIRYKKGKSADYWNNLQPLALCYIWQFSVNDVVYYGRELCDFLSVLKRLPQDTDIIIWVHNLSYEIEFLFNILTIEKCFARSPHKVMYAVFKEFPNITFRCSYFLTRLSLDTWGKQIGIEKLTGYLNYEKIRTPYSQLNDTEMEYCERDCIVVYKGIKKYLETYKTQENIPLTQTGTVRRVIKDKLTANDDYVRFIKRLVPRSAKEYSMLMDVFAGGYTHANRMYALETVSGHIEHYDFASSYPYQMIAQKYPCTPWRITADLNLPDTSTFETDAYIMKLHFINLTTTSLNTYIQASKCTGVGFRYDNGRILHADELTLYVTEQDYLTIIENYHFDSIEVLEKYVSKKDYLPLDYVLYILELYGNKTLLKGAVTDAENDLYMQSKQYINSLFGLMVTAIIQSNVEVINNGEEWRIKPLTLEEVEKRLARLSSNNPRERRYFTSYSWGVYCTAYSRRALWRCIHSIDNDVLYVDTDSIFARGYQDFTWYNNEVEQTLKKMCSERGIDFELTRPKDRKGIVHPIGIFTREDDCVEFKTLGAKRYCERRENGKLYLTVSGINKDAVYILNDDIDNFKNDVEFDKDFPTVTKKLHTYISNMPNIIYPDGYRSTYKHGINIRRNGYKLTITDEYSIIDMLNEMYLDDIPENVLNSMKGVWLDDSNN